jgi:hypothetical protein
MGDLWSDLRIALTLFILVYLVQWAVAGTGSRKIGFALAIIIVFLTVWQHFEILIIVVMFFFGYAFFESFEQTFVPLNK